MNSQKKTEKFLNEILASSPDIESISIVNNSHWRELNHNIEDFNDSNIAIYHDIRSNNLSILTKIAGNEYVKEIIDLKRLENDIFKLIVNDKRQIYIIDSQQNLLMGYNSDPSKFKEIMTHLPKNYNSGEPFIFGRSKNEPEILLKLKNPDWSILVITPKSVIDYGITNARYKIITAIVIAALSIILLCLSYTYSLYTNIRQLFKAITAIGKGNYSRKIRVIKDFFTPYEILFLANAFNNMAEKIDNAYKELQENNKQLALVDKFKSNLIDTVSHEFRTPLTCIKGYASSLLRSDINLDSKTKIKSLKVIKQQTERLSRLVEDLLVIPEIKSSLLRLFPDEVNLSTVIESCIRSISQKQSRTFNLSIDKNFPAIFADPDRLEQVILNLLDNAVKYSPENSKIHINAKRVDDSAVLSIQNECDSIPGEVLNSLFDKFTRLDYKLTEHQEELGWDYLL